ncbi:MAG: LysM peptidoglycan-binding domain-containing protein, partial [Myxococcota bacterium]
GWIASSVLWLSLLGPSIAQAEPAASPDGGSGRRGLVFPPFRKKQKEAPAQPAPAPATIGDGPDPNQPAIEPPTDPAVIENAPQEGIWQWVDRMEGEVPTPEQVEAIEEVSAEHGAERVVIDELTGGEVPLAFYEDPAAALAVDPLFLDRVDPKEFDIPVEVNEDVEKWVRYFLGNGREYYARWLARSTRYQPMMRERLAAAGLPQDLVYLSMIESGYNTNAYSHADAAGLWQFIPSTGKVYDLRIDWWVDDRRDPEAALGAAIAFLGELHHMFGDWRLAWASYNGGPGRVRRAIEKSGSKDFWTIAGGEYLHPETENYVPKIMAAAIIGKHPERYGFTGIKYQDALSYDVVPVTGSVSLEVLAKCAGTSVDELKALNPALRRYATPPEGYAVRVPTGRKDPFVTALASIPADERGAVERHTVRRGETLSIIAGRYHTTVEAISHANQLKNVNRIVVGMNLVIPPGDGELPPAVASSSTSKSSSTTSVASSSKSSRSASSEPAPSEARIVAASMSPEAVLRPSSSSKASPPTPAPAKPKVHVVVRGDTLAELAAKYGTTIGELKTMNNLRTSTIVVGQKLKVPGTASAVEAPEAVVHVVQRGETLTVIAKKYGVDADDLVSWNHLRDPSHVEVGQRLEVKGGPAVAWTTYVVQRGDSLSKIAIKYACSVDDLRSWNTLGSSVIQPGQKLKIKRG